MLIVSKKRCRRTTSRSSIAWLKANPDKANSAPRRRHRRAFQRRLFPEPDRHRDSNFVPYRGTGPALQDLVAGQIDLIVDQASNSLPRCRPERSGPTAITDTKRLAAAPNIPTVDEAGRRASTLSLWYGLWAPKGTPRTSIAKLNAAVVETLADPAVQEAVDRCSASKFRRAAQQTPEACARCRRPKSRSGGRSSRRRTSSRSSNDGRMA